MSENDDAQETVAEQFYRVLRAHGVTKIFGNPGSNELPMLKHLPDDMEYVLALHEGAAVAMADGYAQAGGTVGVVNLHSSSGSGNAFGNLTNSVAAHSPLVLVAGQQSRRYVPYNAMLTNTDATKLYDPLVKWAGEPLRPADVPTLTSQALLLAVAAPRGPVALSVPLDDWDREGEPGAVDPDRAVLGSPVVAEAVIAVLQAEIAAARRPALILGPGADSNAGWEASVCLAERLGAPVWVAPSPSRAPFPTRHGLFRGALPTGLGAVADVLAEHDLVLSFGAAVFRYHQFVDGRPLDAGTRLLGITADAAEAARASTGTLAVGDPVDALARLAASVPTRPGEVPGSRVIPPETDTGAPFTAAAILDAVDRAKPADAVVVLEWTSADQLWHRLGFSRAKSYYFPANGGLGWGLPAAIGIALADSERPVIALIGDGAMQYTPSALWTAAQQGAPVTFVICANGEYGALQRFAAHMQVPDAPYLDVAGLDPVAIAQGYGVPGRALSSLDELETVIAEVGAVTGPRLFVVPQRSQR